MRIDQKRDLEAKIRDEKRLDTLEGRYYVNRYLDKKGLNKPGYKPVKCLCKGKDVPYTHGRFVECRKWACQKHVDDTRKSAWKGGVIVHERQKNAAFWRQMRAAKRGEVYEYARKHGLTHEKAALELEMWRSMDAELAENLRIESEYYHSSEEE